MQLRDSRALGGNQRPELNVSRITTSGRQSVMTWSALQRCLRIKATEDLGKHNAIGFLER